MRDEPAQEFHPVTSTASAGIAHSCGPRWPAAEALQIDAAC